MFCDGLGLPHRYERHVFGINSGMRNGTLDLACRRQGRDQMYKSDRRLGVIERPVLEDSTIVRWRCTLCNNVHLCRDGCNVWQKSSWRRADTMKKTRLVAVRYAMHEAGLC
jgi:hypothetical protein